MRLRRSRKSGYWTERAERAERMHFAMKCDTMALLAHWRCATACNLLAADERNEVMI
jgi:hypothetical protein